MPLPDRPGLESRPVTAPSGVCGTSAARPSTAPHTAGGLCLRKGLIVRHRSLVILTSVLTTGALTLTACGSRDDNDGSDSGSKETDHPDHRRRRPAVRRELHHRPRHPVRRPDRRRRRQQEQARPRRHVQGQGPATTRRSPPPASPNATARHRRQGAVGAVGPLNSGVAQSDAAGLRLGQHGPDLPVEHRPRADPGQELADGKKSGRTRRTSAPPPPTPSRAASPPTTRTTRSRRRSVFVVDDKQTYGAGLAKIFNERFKKLGGKVAGTDHVNTGDTDFCSLVTKIKNSERRPASTTAASTTSPRSSPSSSRTAAPRSRSSAATACSAATYIQTAGKTAEGDLATSVGAARRHPRPPPRTSSRSTRQPAQGRLRRLRRLLLRRRHRHHQGREATS